MIFEISFNFNSHKLNPVAFQRSLTLIMNIFLCRLFFCILRSLLHIKIEVSCLLFIKQSLNNYVESIFDHLILQWNLLQPQFYLHLQFHLICKYYCFNLTLINIILFMDYFRNYSRYYSF